MYSTGSWLGCKILLFGRLWGKKTLKFSLVRGSMVRGSLHHKISHNIENYLQWDFFFPFSSVLISLFISLIESGFDIVCGKSCLVHSFISSFPGKQLGVHIGSPSLLHTLPFWNHREFLCFWTMSKIKNKNKKTKSRPCREQSPQLFLVFFFVALLKGSFPTQFI